MAMLKRLHDGDRLVIVSAEARGDVAALPSALRKRRAGGVLTAPEKVAIAALADAAGLSATSARFAELIAPFVPGADARGNRGAGAGGTYPAGPRLHTARQHQVPAIVEVDEHPSRHQ
jgi:hypothetical protein